MVSYAATVIVACACLFIGYWARELLNYIKLIGKVVRTIKLAQIKSEQQSAPMGFAEPATPEELKELEDDDIIKALNQ